MDLLKLNVAPLAVFQMLKSMCAGQRLASEPQDPVAVSLPISSVPETRGQSRGALCLCVPGGRVAGARRWAVPGIARARTSVARLFHRSSPRTHWTRPRPLPFGADPSFGLVPSFGFNASLGRAV